MLTQEQEEKLKDVFDLAEVYFDKLSAWERGFLYGDDKTKEKGFKSIWELFEEKGSTMFLSDKQWVFIHRIWEKLQ